MMKKMAFLLGLILFCQPGLNASAPRLLPIKVDDGIEIIDTSLVEMRRKWATTIGLFIGEHEELVRKIGVKRYMYLLEFLDRIEEGFACPYEPNTSEFNLWAKKTAISEAESVRLGLQNFSGSGFSNQMQARLFAYGRLSCMLELIVYQIQFLKNAQHQKNFKYEALSCKKIVHDLLARPSVAERFWSFIDRYSRSTGTFMWTIFLSVAILGGFWFAHNWRVEYREHVKTTFEAIKNSFGNIGAVVKKLDVGAEMAMLVKKLDSLPLDEDVKPEQLNEHLKQKEEWQKKLEELREKYPEAESIAETFTDVGRSIKKIDNLTARLEELTDGVKGGGQRAALKQKIASLERGHTADPTNETINHDLETAKQKLNEHEDLMKRLKSLRVQLRELDKQNIGKKLCSLEAIRRLKRDVEDVEKELSKFAESALDAEGVGRLIVEVQDSAKNVQNVANTVSGKMQEVSQIVGNVQNVANTVSGKMQEVSQTVQNVSEMASTARTLVRPVTGTVWAAQKAWDMSTPLRTALLGGAPDNLSATDTASDPQLPPS